MTNSREQLETTIMDATKRLYQSAPKPSEPWLHLDLTIAQIKTLVAVADNETVTIGGVAEALGITLPTASHLVDKLVRAGFVERYEDPIDRRRTGARPTDRGAELIRSLREFNQNHLRACISRMHEADLAALAQGMNALADAASGLTSGATHRKEPVHA